MVCVNACNTPAGPDSLITFKTCLDLGEAHVLRSLLDAHGIPVYLASEHMASAYPSLGYLEAIPVQIRESDRARADAVMADVAVMPNRAAEVADDPDFCPNCGSTHVFRFSGTVKRYFGLAVMEQEIDSKWRLCKQCEHKFRLGASRLAANLWLAFLWGGTLAGLTLGLLFVINWLKYL